MKILVTSSDKFQTKISEKSDQEKYKKMRFVLNVFVRTRNNKIWLKLE